MTSTSRANIEKLELRCLGSTLTGSCLAHDVATRITVLKLTRLNNQTIAINPDHVVSVDVAPDTTIRLLTGDKIIVRESLDEFIERYVELRRMIHNVPPGSCPLGRKDGGDMGFVIGADAAKRGKR
jgi:flagellar protein FlbD